AVTTTSSMPPEFACVPADCADAGAAPKLKLNALDKRKSAAGVLAITSPPRASAMLQLYDGPVNNAGAAGSANRVRFRRFASLRVDHYVAGHGVVFQRVGAQILAVAGLPHAAMRHLVGQHEMAIDPGAAVTKARRRRQPARNVFGPDR